MRRALSFVLLVLISSLFSGACCEEKSVNPEAMLSLLIDMSTHFDRPIGNEKTSAACQTVAGFLHCDYELFLYDHSSDKIIDRFDELVEHGKANGYCPLIIVPSDALATTLQWFYKREGVENTPENIATRRQEIIDTAKETDVAALFSERADQSTEVFQDSYLLGEFEPLTPRDRLMSYLYLYGSYQEVLIAKIPTENPWELAAWIPMGGFNACPMPEEQVAVFHYWYEKYGAIPAVVTSDIWEMKLDKPPVTDEEAEALAKEHYFFCGDVVWQGTQTIRRLASILKNATIWYFWWD